MTPGPSVAVIIPVRDGEGTLRACIESVLAQEGVGTFETIVVDNGSIDRSLEVAREYEPRLRVIARVRGGGPGGARNAGAEAARSPVLAFIDSDCFADRDWLASATEVLDSNDLVQGAVQPVAEPLGPFDHTVRVNRPGYFETANLFIRADWFRRLGGFSDWADGGAGRPFGEDTELGWRAIREGARFRFEPRATVRHAVIPRPPHAYVAEGERMRFFPALAREVPELAEARFLNRWILNRRTGALDLALLGLGAAVVAERPAASLLGAPYLAMLAREARRAGRSKAAKVAVADLLADLVALRGLVAGSFEHRRPLL